MKHLWMGLSLIFIVGAAISLWRQHYDSAFVMATVGVLAWFLNYRVRMKEIIKEADGTDPGDVQLNHPDED